MSLDKNRFPKDAMRGTWFLLAGVFLVTVVLLGTWPDFLTPGRLSILGGVTLTAVAATFLAGPLLASYRPPRGHFFFSTVLLTVVGIGLTFFPNGGLVLPGLDGDITPALARTLLLLAGIFASVWAGLLFHGRNPAKSKQLTAKYFAVLSTLIPLGILAFFVVYVVTQGLPAINWYFLSSGTDMMRGRVGIFPAITGTFSLIIGATLLAVPLGVGAAVFLTEYAKRGWIKGLVGVTADCLWSTPSIVFGLFGFVFLVPRITGHSTLLAGQIVLAAMLLPLTIATSTEALYAVPDEFRHGSLALGASRWWTIRRVVLPSSVPSIVTGVLLGIGRIAGETAPIMLIAVASNTDAPAFFSAEPPYFDVGALFQEVDALPYRLYSIYKAGVGGSIQEAWGTALVLILVVLAFYGLGITVRSYYRRKKGW